MSSKLQSAATKKVSTSVRISQNTSEKQNKPIPKGAMILSKETRIDTEQIENGFIVSKTWDIRWKMKEEDSSEYTYITKKFYSKDDPLTVSTTDKALADLFEDDDPNG